MENFESWEWGGWGGGAGGVEVGSFEKGNEEKEEEGREKVTRFYWGECWGEFGCHVWVCGG